MEKFENYKSLENYFLDCYKQLQVEDYDFFYIYSDLRAFASEIEFKFEKNDFCTSIMNPLLLW